MLFDYIMLRMLNCFKGEEIKLLIVITVYEIHCDIAASQQQNQNTHNLIYGENDASAHILKHIKLWCLQTGENCRLKSPCELISVGIATASEVQNYTSCIP